MTSPARGRSGYDRWSTAWVAGGHTVGHKRLTNIKRYARHALPVSVAEDRAGFNCHRKIETACLRDLPAARVRDLGRSGVRANNLAGRMTHARSAGAQSPHIRAEPRRT